MREWQVGDPIGDGNDIGVPDTKYMGYLRKDNENNQSGNISIKDMELSKQYFEQALKLKNEEKFHEALSYINAAIRCYPDAPGYWNLKGIILWNIMENNGDVNVGMEAYNCFNEALTIKPDVETFKINKMNFLSVWGLALFSAGDFDQAMARANESMALNDNKSHPAYIHCLTVKAGFYILKKDYTKAIKYCDEALEICPDDATLIGLKIDAVALQRKQDLIW